MNSLMLLFACTFTAIHWNSMYGLNQNLQNHSQESDRIIDYDVLLSNFKSIPKIYSPSVITFHPKSDKQLTYIAVHHTNDINSPVAKKIKEVIDTVRPEFCIIEGFNDSEGLNPQRIIAIANHKVVEGLCGENLFAVNLCHQKQIDFIGADIDEKIYLEAFKEFGITQQDIVFFLLAQQIPFWHRDGAFQSLNPKPQFESFMREEVSEWLDIPSVDYTYEDFLSWHEKHIGKPYNPEQDFLWSYESVELMPYLGDDATIYQKICAYTLYMRDKNIIKLIEKAMMKYSSVLVIYGSAHYSNQSEILQRLYYAPVKNSKIENN